jgi:hypothetical protein
MRRASKIALAGLALATAMTPAGPAAGQAKEKDAPRVTQPAFATNGRDEAPGHSYTSPGVVVDPDNPRLVYAATVDIRSNRCALIRSSNGGRTWTKGKSSPSPEGFPFCTHDNGFIPHSFLKMGRDKTLYFLHIGWDVQDGGRSENRSVFVARTRDGGDNWESTPVNLNRGKTGNDIQKNVPTDLVVDTTTGEQDIVYAAYTASWPNPTNAAGSATRPNQPFIGISTDGGKTFGPPVNVATKFYEDPANIPTDLTDAQKVKENFGGSGLNLAVDEKGTLYGAWNRSTANITPVAPPTALYYLRSTDRAKTFNTTVLQPPHADQSGPTGTFIEWSPKPGENGSLHVIWEGKLVTAQGDRDVYYRRSLDEGKTWTDVKTLNDDDQAQLYGQFQPNIAVAPNGRIDVAWWDMRDAFGRFATDVYYTTSHDNGATWSKNSVLTDRSIDRTMGVWKPGTGGDVRQPPGIASADELTVVVWDDTRHGNPQTEQQDLYATTLQYQKLAGSGVSRAAGYALAAVIGVAVVGLLLAIGAMALRGRRPEPPARITPGRDQVEVR